MDLYLPGVIVPSGRCRYTIVKNLVQGAFAYSYEVKDDRGSKWFLKGYSEPLPNSDRFPWFDKYRALQQEMQTRLRNIEGYALQTQDEFVYNGIYHMVLDWAQGRSLEDLYKTELQKDARNEKSLLLAKVMMYALSQLHEQNIIHCDQKLANFFAQEDLHIGARYLIKAADFDMSLLADQPGPKPDGKALAGTFGYLSPEHLRSERPQFGSDVFTVGGIMLFELFAGRHPFEEIVGRATTEVEANAAILKAVERGQVPRLADVAPARAATVSPALQEIVHACFASRYQDRPTSKDIHKVLLGRPLRQRLVLIGGSARLKWRIDGPTTLSRKMATALFQAAAATVSAAQAQLEPSEDKTEWFVTPSAAATNKTMLNGKEVVGRTPLRSGMKLQVGNPASGRIGFEVEVTFERL